MADKQVRHRKRVVRRQYNLNHPNNNTNDETYSACANEQEQRRPSYVRRKPEELMCSICNGAAHGYNFNTITCESCKAFFRRNALRTDGKFKCRDGDDQCVITVSTRKRCKACRLAKCFRKGMRADWILTDEERVNKRLKIEENRRLRQTLYPDSPESDQTPYVECKSEPVENKDYKLDFFSLPLLLTSEDYDRINRIQQAYDDSVRLTSLPPQIPSYPHTARLEAAWDMMNLPTNLQSTRLITFYKLLPEFSSLTEHDKLNLIKYNIFSLVFIRSALIYDRITDSYHDAGTSDCVFNGKDLIQCFSFDQYEKSTRCVCRLIEASRNDHLIIKIFLLIAIFSKGSSTCAYIPEAEPIAENISSILHVQNIFIDLLWKYCENKFGWIQTIDIWSKLVTASIDAHLQAYNTQYNYVKNDLVADQLVPLMKSVMLNV